MSDPEQTKLLTEIRDLLASREQKYAEYMKALDQRNAEMQRHWNRGYRGRIILQQVGMFIVIYAAVYLAMLNFQWPVP